MLIAAMVPPELLGRPLDAQRLEHALFDEPSQAAR
jgi:hypothetical protein